MHYGRLMPIPRMRAMQAPLAWNGNQVMQAAPSMRSRYHCGFVALSSRCGAHCRRCTRRPASCHSHNTTSVSTDPIDGLTVHCDLFDMLHGSAYAVNTYYGEYLPAYPWASFPTADLDPDL